MFGLLWCIDAAFEDGRKMDSCLMVGGPGLGKSALARVISNEMATDFYEVIGQSITSPADLNAFLLTAQEKSICHIDECHELKREYQTALYLAIDQQKLFMGGGKSIQSLPIADAVWPETVAEAIAGTAAISGTAAKAAPPARRVRRVVSNVVVMVTFPGSGPPEGSSDPLFRRTSGFLGRCG